MLKSWQQNQKIRQKVFLLDRVKGETVKLRFTLTLKLGHTT
jgi:hypothetical protein